MDSTARAGIAGLLALISIAGGVAARAQPVELAPVDPDAIAEGVSARKLTGQTVVNSAYEPIGMIEDFVIAPKQKATFAVIDVGGYLDTTAHPIAVPSESLVIDDATGRVILPHATREALNRLPVYSPGK